MDAMMKTASSSFRIGQLGAVLALMLCMGGQVDAHEAKHEAVVAPLLAEDLVGQAGKEVIMLTVEYPPGGGSQPHRHEAQVFVYVLQGRLHMQVEGQAPVTLRTGETFYENPQDIHVTSANASTTEPVKFLVMMVKNKNQPASLPADTGNGP